MRGSRKYYTSSQRLGRCYVPGVLCLRARLIYAILALNHNGDARRMEQPAQSIYDVANAKADAAIAQYQADKLHWRAFKWPTAGDTLTDRAAFVQGYTGFIIPGIGESWLTSEDIKRWVEDCKFLRAHPHPLYHDITDTHKQCPRCEMYLPASTKYFSINKHGRHGLHSVCKSCKSAYDHERYMQQKRRAFAA